MSADPQRGRRWQRLNVERWSMRVMVIVKATAASEAGLLPSAELLEAMNAFNQQLIDAGVLVDAGGLKPSAEGARIALTSAEREARPGPFPQTLELISGYWIWLVEDLDQAIDWAKRCPTSPTGPVELELRPLYEEDDFA